jgi:hypothetical protein
VCVGAEGVVEGEMLRVLSDLTTTNKQKKASESVIYSSKQVAV